MASSSLPRRLSCLRSETLSAERAAQVPCRWRPLSSIVERSLSSAAAGCGWPNCPTARDASGPLACDGATFPEEGIDSEWIDKSQQRSVDEPHPAYEHLVCRISLEMHFYPAVCVV